MVLVQRHSDSRWYPTTEFLTTALLAPFAFRRVAVSELTEGDPVPRSVYHCTRRLPTVLLFRGETHYGKSSAARNFETAVTKVIALDVFVYRIAVSKFQHGAAQKFIKAHFNSDDLSSLYKSLDANALTEEYVALLAGAIAASDASVIIEGLMTDAQANALTNRLRGKAIVWGSTRRFPSHS